MPTAAGGGRDGSRRPREVFEGREQLRGYVLDDQGALRHHVTVFVDGVQVRDRTRLAEPVEASTEIYVMQALSGG